jgi:hypothetical protein
MYHSLSITGGPCQRGQEFELVAEAYSVTLSDGGIAVVEGCFPGDVLLLRRNEGYVYCGSASPDSTLNREPSSQRRLVNSDELRIGPFRLQYGTDLPTVIARPRAIGFDWLRASICSLAMALLLMLAFLQKGSATGGSGDRGDGSGMSDAGEGVGKGNGSGFGDEEGAGGGTGETGSGSGTGASGGGTGAGSATEVTEVAAAETAPEPSEAAVAPPGNTEPETPETPEPTAAPPPPPSIEKLAILSLDTGVAPTPPPSASAGLIGERGGGGQVLGTGDVQITLRWDTAPDLDLHVTDPNGEEIWFENIRSSSGGTLDVDDTEFEGPENIFWPTGRAPRGDYTVDVVLFEGATANWWVRTRIDGVEKIHRGSLVGEGQKKRVVMFSR